MRSKNVGSRQKAAEPGSSNWWWSAIFNGMSLSHHCSQVPVGVRGTRAENAGHDIVAILKLPKCCCSRSRSSGAVISSLTSWDTSRPTLPMLCTSSRHRLISSRYIHHSNSGIQGRQDRPPPDTPAPQLQIKFPDCHKRQPEPGPAHHHLAETHLSCNLVWHRPYLPSSCNYRALL